jgi:hypothetical protein
MFEESVKLESIVSFVDSVKFVAFDSKFVFLELVELESCYV